MCCRSQTKVMYENIFIFVAQLELTQGFSMLRVTIHTNTLESVHSWVVVFFTGEMEDQRAV